MGVSTLEMDTPDLPQNLGSLQVPKPSKEEALAKYRSRFYDD